VGVEWQFLSRSQLQLGGFWEDQELDEGDSQSGRYTVGLSRGISHSLLVSFDVTRLITNSESDDDYRDWSAQLGLSWEL
jgi:hypothetical protein